MPGVRNGNAYLPADLAHKPPQERRSQHEVVFDVSCDGIHTEHDSLGTLPLRQYLSR